MIEQEKKIIDLANSFNIPELKFAVEEIVKLYNKLDTKNYSSYVKEDGTYVTEIDYLIEKTLIEGIKTNYGADNLVTEEFNSGNEIVDRTWIIDPIDGTIHFIKKDYFWGTQLAFYANGGVLFSVIYMPNLNEFYIAVKGKGAFLNGEKIQKQQTCDAAKCMVEIVGSYYKASMDKLSVLFKCMRNDKNVVIRNLLYINSCCAGFTNLASGRTDAVVLSTKKPWDIMPGVFLCEELGLKAHKIKNCKEITLYSNDKQVIDLFAE